VKRLRAALLAAALFAAGAFYGRYRARLPAPPPPQPPSRQEIIDGFHKIYYDASTYTWSATRWLGTPVLKNPLDLWVMQEIVYENRPDLVIETGTYLGGAALYFAHLFDLLGRGRVVTIDIKDYPERAKHRRVEFLLGSSTDPEIVKKVEKLVRPLDKVMVTLDSDHRAAHVREELRIYSRFVTKDQYLIVEDTNVNGHPVQPAFGPGPREAVEEFLRQRPEFTADHMREKHILTHNPRGWLRRVR
jgi:cephalosporin hydroxylase